ncbi:MAG: hypothetical protein JW724_01045 [Candidatus Altiarchaeota archaeon]|nr:hypothetical protein [Candidatus Altiarchaeota archaeon]
MADKPVLEKEFNEGIDVDKRVSEGAILGRIYIEVQGNDEEACRKALERTIFDSLAKEEPVKLLNVKFYELTKDPQASFFSGVVEAKLLFRDFRWLVNVVMRYGPTAIEIIEPHEVELGLDEMQSVLADVSELSQTFSSQIFALLKDGERKAIYAKMLKGQGR